MFAPSVIAVCALTVVGGCSSEPAAAPAPRAAADLLLSASVLPAGFTLAPLSVSELTAGNRAGIEAAKSTRVTPEYCRPTADAALNGQLSADNSAVLAARDGASGGLVELVTTAPRDIDADRLTTTGRCARTTTEITSGNLAGSRVVTEYTELPAPEIEGGLIAGEQMLLTRSEVTTTLPDGGVRRQIGFAGYAALDRPTSGRVTVQLTVSGTATPATTPPTEPAEPVDAETFTNLFDAAVERVTTP
nr:hypothetical protein [Gordonia jinghuaiqii]